MSGQVTILQLPTAAALTGSESVPVVQNGVTVQTTTGAISGAGALNYPFLTVGTTAGLTQARYLSTGAGLNLSDTGAGGVLSVNMTGAANSLNLASNGLIVKTSATTVASVQIAVGSGMTIANADGTAGNPTIGLSTLLQNFSSLSSSGLIAVNGTTVSQITITGTSGQISVANGASSPVISLSTSGVSAGSYTLANLTVDTYGRLTSASSASTTGTGSVVLNNSPTLVGTPAAPTAALNTNTTQLATTAFVIQQVSASGGGTVTSVSVTSANGFAGSVASPTSTPAITLSTTVTGIVKGNGTGISAATAGTDYLAPPSGTAILKANSGGALANAVSGTDYAPATSGTSILYGNNAGGFSNVTIGSGLSFSTGTLTSTGSGGSVTSVNASGGTTGLSFSGGPITTSGTLTLSGTLAVSNGGTGVTASSGANSVVLRDANGNITTNSIFEGYSNVAAAGTTTVLTASSVPNYVVTGSGGQTYQLPDATTLPNGSDFTFNNNQSSGTIVVKNNSSTTIVTIQSGSFVTVSLLSNSIAAGSWDYHAAIPSGTSWSTNTLSTGAAITSTQAVTGSTLISTVGTGTAPLTVTSTTQVANLNAASAGTATNATNVALSAGTGATNYLTFSAIATGNQPLTTNTLLTYNYTNNTLLAGISGGAF